MKFLKTPKETEAAVRRLIRKCKRMRWAVAWASRYFSLFDLLKKNELKIEQLTVGIHFYQTHPDFIEEFRRNDASRFVMNPNGVFHPKLYFFEHEGGGWDCISGSPNFTKNAFSTNNEVAIHISDEDRGADEALNEILSALNDFHELGDTISEKQLEDYRSAWKRRERPKSTLSGVYGSEKRKKREIPSPLEFPTFTAQWKEYFESVRNPSDGSGKGRLEVMEEARRLFEKYGRFSDMPPGDRKGIAGYGVSERFDWLWFGSMKGAGYFKQAVNENNPKISEALDQIPLSGIVTKENYERYQEIIGQIKNMGVATSTRLLALKRPDYFLCLDSKNRSKLTEAFGIPKSVGLEGYWDQVIQRIQDSNWWESPEPTDELELRVWKCRSAFIDVRFYDPD